MSLPSRAFCDLGVTSTLDSAGLSAGFGLVTVTLTVRWIASSVGFPWSSFCPVPVEVISTGISTTFSVSPGWKSTFGVPTKLPFSSTDRPSTGAGVVTLAPGLLGVTTLVLAGTSWPLVTIVSVVLASRPSHTFDASSSLSGMPSLSSSSSFWSAWPSPSVSRSTVTLIGSVASLPAGSTALTVAGKSRDSSWSSVHCTVPAGTVPSICLVSGL